MDKKHIGPLAFVLFALRSENFKTQSRFLVDDLALTLHKFNAELPPT